MTTVSISPTVALAETRAELEHFRNRSLIQAQAIADLQAQVAAASERIAHLQSLIPEAQPASEEEAHG